ncbi:hypothetical protein C5S53_05605 [Methanophagales archaeon]|nr:hypothetical protein C5S53_05605 [Methanophagales archaeon]
MMIVTMEMNGHAFLFRHPTIRIVNAASIDITTISTGKCSTGLNIRHHIPLFISHLFKDAFTYEESEM